MPTRVERRTVNLSAYPDLVVIYLGMRVNRITGIKTLLGFGPKISSSAEAQPDGLLRHETFIFSLFPMHAGIRQYWRDVNSLLEWTRSEPHRQWWQDFLKDSGGTGFWHETYFRRGGIEAVYDDVPENIGLMARTSGTGSRTDVWRSSKGRKGIWRTTRTVRGRTLRGARNTTVNYAQTGFGPLPVGPQPGSYGRSRARSWLTLLPSM
jgi:hypothetical protein